MRIPKYLSPSSIDLFEKDQEAYYLRYLADRTPPRDPQTQPMSVGSAFDAYCKSYLYNTLIGDKNPKYEFDSLFEAQVESHNRDWALEAGKFVFHFYQKYGGLSNLMLELQNSIGPVRFEIDVYGTVDGSRESKTGEVNKIPLLGKPDIHFMNQDACSITLDWKVNGYCSASGISPLPGYLRLFPGFIQHPDCVPGRLKNFGINVNNAHQLQNINESYARQLSIYSWLCGVEVGEIFVAGIDQICCNNSKPMLCESTNSKGPDIRVAQHRTTISAEYQYALRDRITYIWECVTSGHFFPDLTKEQSESRCRLIEQTYFDDEERPQ